MAIIFSEKQKKQQSLILVFITVAVLTGLVFYFGVFKKPKDESIIILVPPKNVVINFEILKNPLLSRLELFEEVIEFEGEIGRDNPFNPPKAEKP
ncbi:hypothetical protein L6250_02490 [Candidatus Parcubacteria bacterium]|nr:hypothetical protein [Patescibacteria group bacterium]MBU4466919.1 hypothetical protein [Patescibacteria group bacterium]MCG2688480.1 hypothetical protein [Candidatus Parcubacteria bacterium]